MRHGRCGSQREASFDYRRLQAVGTVMLAAHDRSCSMSSDIVDLPALLRGVTVVVGSVIRPGLQDWSYDHVKVGELVLAVNGTSSMEMTSVVVLRCDGDETDLRRARQEALVTGSRTCLTVGGRTPVNCLVKQLHMGHEYVIVRWQSLEGDRFLRGLTTMARSEGITVIADGLIDAGDVRAAEEALIEFGVLADADVEIPDDMWDGAVWDDTWF